MMNSLINNSDAFVLKNGWVVARHDFVTATLGSVNLESTCHFPSGTQITGDRPCTRAGRLLPRPPLLLYLAPNARLGSSAVRNW